MNDRTQSLTQDDLQAIEARCAAATPPPWPTPEEVDFDDWRLVLEHEGRPVAPWARREDMIFAYRAREDVPRLLAEIRRLRALLEGE